MAKYDVWEAVPRADHRTIPGKCVFTRKNDGKTGKPAKFKAKFVAKGFRQVKREGLQRGLCLCGSQGFSSGLLAICNYLGIPIHQINIKGAFLNGNNDFEVLIEPPEGMPIPAGMVLRLKRSLYGLKQSPHLFNKTMDSWL